MSVSTLALFLLTAAPSVEDPPAPPKVPEPAMGAAVGAAVGAGASGLTMLGVFLVATNSQDGISDLVDVRQRAGAVPSVVAAALVSSGSAGLGAGLGYAFAGGDVLEAPPAVGGAMLGATLVSAVGAVPAALLFQSSDDITSRPPNDLGDAIGSGIAAGLAEASGMLTVVGTSLFLVPPAAFAGALLLGRAFDDDGAATPSE